MYKGTITFVSGRGWCFAERDDDSSSIFFHQNQVEHQRYLKVDDRIQFEVGPNPKNPNRLCAVNVKYLGHCVARQSGDPAVRP